MTDVTRRILKKAAALAGAVALTCIIVIVLGHDPNAAVMSLVDKHDRLASLHSPKIVLIGDSNLTYGMESAELERELGLPVVNTGYMGSLGMRFMLEDAAPDIHTGDIVVVSMVYEEFNTLLDGEGETLWGALLARPASLRAVTSLEQVRQLAIGLPGLIQKDAKRAIISPLLHRFMGKDQTEWKLYGRKDFNAQGDLTGIPPQDRPEHLDAPKPLASPAMTPEALTVIDRFTQHMRAKEVTVIFSFPPISRAAYDLDKAGIASIERGLRDRTHLAMPSTPEHYVFQPADMYDTHSHLFGEARLARTKLMAEDIKQALR